MKLLRRIARGLACCGLAIITIIAFSIFIYLLLSPAQNTTFDVFANTEIIAGRFVSATEIPLLNAVICHGPEMPDGPPHFPSPASSSLCRAGLQVLDPFSGTLMVAPNTTFRIERLADQPLRILLEDSGVIAFASGDHSGIPLAAPILIELKMPLSSSKNNGGFFLSYRATDVVLGTNTPLNTYGSYPQLVNGRILALTHQLSDSSSHLLIFSADLQFGDFFYVDKQDLAATSIFTGLISVSNTSVLSVSQRVTADRGIVGHFFSAPYVLQVSLLDRLFKDPVSDIFWSLLSLVIGSGILSVMIPAKSDIPTRSQLPQPSEVKKQNAGTSSSQEQTERAALAARGKQLANSSPHNSNKPSSQPSADGADPGARASTSTSPGTGTGASTGTSSGAGTSANTGTSTGMVGLDEN